MTNGLEIKNKDDIERLYKDNPNEVVIFIALNLMDVKKDLSDVKHKVSSIEEKCSCRQETCNREMNDKINKKMYFNRFKNFIIQFPGGALGGVIACYFLLKLIKLI